MSFESFLPPFSSGRTRPSRARRKRFGGKARDRARAALELLEPRTLLSTTTLPAVSVVSTPVLNNNATAAINNPSVNNPNNISDPSQDPTGNTNYKNANESSPTVVIDQADPNKMVAVWTIYDPNQESIPKGDYLHGHPLQSDVQGAYTTDGGQTWKTLTGLNVSPDIDPSITPSTDDPRPTYTWITDADVAFDPNTETLYVTYLEHDAASGGKAGELLLQKYDFSGPTPVIGPRTTVSSWLQPPSGDPYVMGYQTPTLAVDGNAPSFTDTDSTGNAYTQTDQASGNIYVAWVVQHALGTGGSKLKSDIQITGSSDGGNTFTSPVDVNTTDDLNYNANTDNYTPQIAISQGRPTVRDANGNVIQTSIPGGQVTVVWDANTRNSNTDAIRANTATAGLVFSGVRNVAATAIRGTGFLTGSGSNIADPLGFGPSPAIAIDNTLGAYSPYQGDMYIAFAYHDPNNTNNNPNAGNPNAVRLMRSTDGGQTWAYVGAINDDDPYTDGFYSGGNLYLMPSLAVDPTTGTLVASWYDGRYDPSHARLAMMVAASNDGGQTFSKNQFVNTALTAQSGITNQTLTRGPLLDNQSGGAAETNFSYGVHQGLAVYGGQVVPVWSGNLDGNLSGNQQLDILTSQVRVSGGPRIISSTMGPIGQSSATLNTGRVKAGSPESANAAVGTPMFQQIEVDFDRPVAFNSAADPNAFDPSDVQVYYQKDTYDPVTGALTGSQLVPVPVGGITPLGTNRWGEASRFLVTLAQPQTAVGVYTYTISAGIKDKIRAYNYATHSTTVPESVGSAMDQNANGSGGTSSAGNGYSVPLLAGQSGASSNPSGFPSGPYRPDMLPVVIPGPYITSTYTNSDSSLQKDGTVSSLFVQFDRFVDVSTFSTNGQYIDPRTDALSPILRLMGPTGDMTGAAGGFKITPVDGDGNGSASLFRIDFKNAVAYSGTYTLQIASGVKTKAVGSAPACGMDTNLNAGLDVFRGGQGASGETSTTVTQSAVGAGGVGPVPDAATNPVTGEVTGPGIGVFSLNFGQDFLIPQSSQLVGNPSVLTVQLSISTQSDHDLTAILIAPDGHWITLFNQVTATGTGANFSNTVIDDQATANIQLGGAPFFGSYTPGGGIPDAGVLASLGLDPAAYKATLTDLASSVGHSGGTWKLAVIDNAKNDIAASLTAWSLSIQKPVLKSGMNEPVADQYTADFRIFTMDPTNPLSSNTWTAVGPASAGTNNALAVNTGSQTPADEGLGGPNSLESGPVTGLAFDPSDPSHNTAYVGGGSGGIWKTTNFLSPNGPTYVPLTNFGPNNAVNIGGIAVFGRNHDPNQSVVFAATGEGDTNSPGAGILRSTDGGATWQVLDSTSNVDANGNLLPIDAPGRDHVFVGNSSYKVVVDPTATASGGIVVYVAMSGPNGGLWRSLDSGNHWKQLKAGSCTDVALDPNSGRTVSNGLLQNVWAAFAGEGVFFSSTQGTGLQVVSGGVGSPFIQAIATTTRPLLVGNLSTNPNGASGRIVLAKPDLTGNPAEDLAYQGWIYAAVVDTAGNFSGLYQTKDFGQNWVQLRIPMFNPPTGPQMPSNDTTRGDFNIAKGSGKRALSIAVDPQDPNIVYLGGSTGGLASGLIRVDATLAADTHALAPYSATNPDGGKLLRDSTGPVSVANLNLAPTNYQGQYWYSLIHNPYEPFSNATLLVNNGYTTSNGGVTSQFANDGSGVTWIPFDIYTGTTGSNYTTTTGQHRMVTFTDPATGYTRLVIADDEGVFTTMDDHGTQVGSLGSYPVTASDRNGNIQITQLYYGAAQPDGSVFYGSAGSNVGGPEVYDPLGTGNITGSGLAGNASGVAVDPQGLGTLYQYWNGTVVNPDGGQDSTDFFRVFGNDVFYGQGRTFGLVQSGGSGTADPQWPLNAVVNFAVNPLSGQQVLISSTTGNIFTTQDQGLSWHQVAGFGSQSMAMAYGAPDPSVSTGLGDFLYVGTNSGKINVSTDGGGTWTDISAGLDGSAVKSIVTNPTRGSHEAYAVTANGVYHIADSTASGASWSKINGNLFNLRRNVFPNSTSSVSASTLDQNVQPYYLPVKPALASDNPGVTEMDLTISGHPGQTVGDLSATLDSLQLTGAGASLGDLKVVLVAPDGKTQITLFDQAGDTGSALSGTTFSDLGAALSSGQAPYTGSYKPSDSSAKLSDFTGQYIDGTWKLLVYNSNTTTQGILGNFSLYFSSGNAQAAGALTSLAVDWRYNLPDDPANPGTGPGQTHPALYVGGVGGVFRSFDDGQTWGLFPDGTTAVTGAKNTTSANNSPLGDGGGMSSVQVSDLDMVLGNIDPTTGQADISTGPNLLLASSYGQGQFAIRLAPVTLPNQTGQTPLLSIDHTDGYSDTGTSSTDGITSNETPYITGYSEQTAYGNVVTVRIYDQTPNSPTFGQLVGIGQTDGFGKFRIQICQYDAGGNKVLDQSGNPVPVPLFTYNGQKVLGVQATNATGTIGNMAVVGNSLSPVFLELNAPSPADIVLAPGNDSGTDGDNITNPGLIVTQAPSATQGELTFNITVDGSVQNGNATTPKVTLMRLDQNGLYEPVASADVPKTGSLNEPITVQIADPGPFQNGYAYTYAVQITDAQGNIYDPNGDPDPSDLKAPHVLTVVIDATPPVPGAVQLDPDSDSGLNISTNGTTVTPGFVDNITNPTLVDGKLVFDAQVGLADRGDTVILVRKDPQGNYTVLDSSATVASGVPDPQTSKIALTLTDPGPFGASGSVADGTYTYYLKIVDIAGNSYVPQDDPDRDLYSTSVVVDTTAPSPDSVILRLDPASNSDSDSDTPGDDRTDPTQLTPVNRLSYDIYLDPADRYSLVTLYRDGRAVSSATYASASPAVDLVSGLMKVKLVLTDPGPFTGGFPNPDGTYFYNYTVGVEDRAGNTGTSNPLTVTITTALPNQGELVLDPSSDTGQSDTDNITSPAQTASPSTPGTLQFHLTLDKNNAGQISNDTGATVYLLRSKDGGLTYNRVGSSVLTTKDPVSGLPVATLADPGTGSHPFADGTYYYQVEVINKAGIDNKEAALPVKVTVDTTPPTAPSTPVLAPGSDSGQSGDNITNVNNPYFTGTAEAGDLVQLIGPAGTVYGQATADSQGNYTVQAGILQSDGSLSALPDGTYTFYVETYDLAGNPSPRSAASAQITINAAPISPQPTLKLTPGDDTGPGGPVSPGYFSDNVTKVTTPTLQGTGKNGLTVEILDVGGSGFNTVPGDVNGVVTDPDGSSTVLVQNGTFTFQIKQVLTDGKYNLVARTFDPATGSYSDSAPLVLTVMTGAGLKAPSSFGLDPATDTGTKGDGVTSDHLYGLTGHATPGTLVELVADGGDVTRPVDTEVVGPDGTFTLRPQAMFVNGTITYRAYSVDIAGNLSPQYASSTVRITTTPGDFNGDGTSDATTFNRSTGVFTITESGTGNTVTRGPVAYQGKVLSGPNMIPIQGDFNGDGTADYGVYDFAHAVYYIEESSVSGARNLVVQNYGWAGHDLPLMADFDGDGTTDFAVYRPETSTFYARLSSDNKDIQYQFGQPGDQPGVGDFNGDGATDIAVYRPSTAHWYIQPVTISTNGTVQNKGLQTSFFFGWAGVDQPAPADYDGDGKTDLAVYRPAGSSAGQTRGQFYIRSSDTGQTSAVPVGTPGQVTASAIPEALDFNGDGQADPSVYQPSSSQWAFQLSGAAPLSKTLGTSGSLPAAAPLYPYRLPASFSPPQSAGGSVATSSKPVSGDFNGDGQADVLTFNRFNGVFSLTYSGTGTTTSLGPITYQGKVLSGPNMIPIQGDFNGDGKADFGVYDYAHAVYYIEESSPTGALSLKVQNYGWGGHDLPLMADFDGDGTTDFAVFRPSNATWYARLSSTGQDIQYAYGWANHDQPVVGDFNGDGKTDLAVFRPSSAQWFIQPVSITASGQVKPLGKQTVLAFGWAGVDQPAPADYDGDGKTDIAIYRKAGSNAGQTQAQFHIQSSGTGQTSVVSVGTPGQVAPNAIPEALDFNGDGKADPSVYQPSTSQWSFQLSGAGASSKTLGTAGSLPTAAPLSPYRLPGSSSLVSTASVVGLTDFEAAPSALKTTAATSAPTALASAVNHVVSTKAPVPAETLAAPVPETTVAPAETVPAAQPQTASIGARRMALVRRLGLVQQRQAQRQQALFARRAAQAAKHQLVPGGLLALRDRWRL